MDILGQFEFRITETHKTLTYTAENYCMQLKSEEIFNATRIKPSNQ